MKFKSLNIKLHRILFIRFFCWLSFSKHFICTRFVFYRSNLLWFQYLAYIHFMYIRLSKKLISDRYTTSMSYFETSHFLFWCHVQLYFPALFYSVCSYCIISDIGKSSNSMNQKCENTFSVMHEDTYLRTNVWLVVRVNTTAGNHWYN